MTSVAVEKIEKMLISFRLALALLFTTRRTARKSDICYVYFVCLSVILMISTKTAERLEVVL